MADDGYAYESWVGSETSIGTEQLGSSWDVCQLGSEFLPGVVTIEDFEYGVDIDVQKKRKKEKCKIRDNGLAPCAFTIKVEITAELWPQWLKVLPAIQPRREGAIRKPMAIVHPLPNSHNVKDVYVHKIKIDPPSARTGMVITIKVAEWFEEEKEAKGATKKTAKSPTAYQAPDYFNNSKELADQLSINQGNPVSTENVMANAFGAPPPEEPLPGEIGWHGYKSNEKPTAAPKATNLGFNPFRRGG